MLTVGWQDPTNERPSRSSWLAWATRRSVSAWSCSSVTGSQVRLAGRGVSDIAGRIVADGRKGKALGPRRTQGVAAVAADLRGSRLLAFVPVVGDQEHGGYPEIACPQE